MFISIRIVQGANTLFEKWAIKKKLELIYPKVSKLFNTKLMHTNIYFIHFQINFVVCLQF